MLLPHLSVFPNDWATGFAGDPSLPSALLSFTSRPRAPGEGAQRWPDGRVHLAVVVGTINTTSFVNFTPFHPKGSHGLGLAPGAPA